MERCARSLSSLLILAAGFLGGFGCVDEIEPPEAVIEVEGTEEASDQTTQALHDAGHDAASSDTMSQSDATAGDADSEPDAGGLDASFGNGDTSTGNPDATGDAGTADTGNDTSPPDEPEVGDAMFDVGERITLDGSASSDPNDMSLTYRWSFVGVPPRSDVSFNNRDVVRPAFLPDVPGSYRVKLVVSNGVHSSTPAFETIEVSDCGSFAPVVASVSTAPSEPGVEEPISLSPDVTDQDNSDSCGLDQTFDYEWSLAEVPTGSEANLNHTEVAEPTLTADVPGTYVADLVVRDSAGNTSETQRVPIEVQACGNAAPRIDDLQATPSMPNVDQQVGLEVQPSDADTSSGCGRRENFSYDWRLIELPADSRAELQNPNARTPSLVPDASGTYTVEVVVTDSTGRTSEPAELSIEVSSCGEASPVAGDVTATPQNPNTGQLVQLDAQPSDADNTDDCGLDQSISYEWSLVELPSGSSASLNAPHAANPSFTPEVPGEYRFRLAVTDSTGRSSPPTELTVTVDDCGSAAPSPGTLTADPATPNTHTTVQLGASPTDTDNTACGLDQQRSYRWSLVAAPAGSTATLTNTTALNPSFTPDEPGDYTLRFTVTDSTGRSSEPQTLTVTAAPCGAAAPTTGTVDASPSQPAVAQTTRLNSNPSDSDNSGGCGLDQSLDVHWEFVSVPQGSSASLNQTGVDSPSFTPDVPGPYSARVTVTDETGRTDRDRVTVDVRDCGSFAPLARLRQISPSSSGAGQNVTGNSVEVGGTVQVTAAPSEDPDNTTAGCNLDQTLQYHWQFAQLPSGSDASLNDSSLLNPSFTVDEPGTYVLYLRVTDSTGRRSGRAIFTIDATTLADANFKSGFSGSTVSSAGLIDEPRGLTGDDNGNTYLAERTGSRILKIDGSGNVTSFSSGLNRPEDVTFDPVNDELYATYGNSRIAELTLTGTRTNCTNNGGIDLSGLQYYDGAGGGPVLLTADRADERIRVLDLNCNLLFTNEFDGRLDRPSGVAAREIGGVDYLAASDRGSEAIFRNVDGTYTNNGGTNNRVSDGDVDTPNDVAFTPCANSKIVAADTGNGRIVAYDNCSSNGCNRQVLVSEIDAPRGLHFVSDQELLVSDSGDGAVFEINGDFCSL